MRDSSDICVEVCFWVSSAMVSVGAAIGVVEERREEGLWKGRVRGMRWEWEVVAIRGGCSKALRRGWRARRKVMKEVARVYDGRRLLVKVWSTARS